MHAVVGSSTIPMATGLVVGVGAFLAWAGCLVRRQRSEAVTAVASVAAPAPTPTATTPAPVGVVLRPHYVVAAPDDAAVRAAMSHRVRPPVPLRVPARAPAAPSLPRSA